MTDLEMTKLCAEAMGLNVQLISAPRFPSAVPPFFTLPNPCEGPNERYDPLHDDAQAMALVKRFKLHPGYDMDANEEWECYAMGGGYGKSADFNRAIVECVAKMRRASL